MQLPLCEAVGHGERHLHPALFVAAQGRLEQGHGRQVLPQRRGLASAAIELQQGLKLRYGLFGHIHPRALAHAALHGHLSSGIAVAHAAHGGHNLLDAVSRHAGDVICRQACAALGGANLDDRHLVCHYLHTLQGGCRGRQRDVPALANACADGHPLIQALVTHIRHLQFIFACGNLIYDKNSVEIRGGDCLLLAVPLQHDSHKWQRLASLGIDDGSPDNTRIETQGHLTAIVVRRRQGKSEHRPIHAGNLPAAEGRQIPSSCHRAGTRTHLIHPDILRLDEPWPETTAVAPELVQRLVVHRQAEVRLHTCSPCQGELSGGLRGLQRLPVQGVAAGDAQVPPLLLAGLQAVAEGLYVHRQPQVGPDDKRPVLIIKSPAVAHSRQVHHETVFHIARHGDDKLGGTTAVEHHHAAAVDLGGMADAVVERLLAKGAAQLEAHGVAHADADSHVRVPPVRRGAQPHHVVARHPPAAGHVVDQRVMPLAVGGADADAVEARRQAVDVQTALAGGALVALGHHGPQVPVALLGAEGQMGEGLPESRATAHPPRIGMLLHQAMEHSQRVGLPQLVEFHVHIAFQGLMVEVVVDERQVAQVVGGDHAVAVGIAHVERQALLVQFAVGVYDTHVGGIDIGPERRRPGGNIVALGGEGKLEQSVVVHRQAVGIGEIVSYGGTLPRVNHPLARHLPLHLRPGHGCTAEAHGGTVDGDRLAETARRTRVGPFGGGGERHGKTRRLVGLHLHPAVAVVGLPQGAFIVRLHHPQGVGAVLPVGRNDELAPAAAMLVGGEEQGVFRIVVGIAKGCQESHFRGWLQPLLPLFAAVLLLVGHTAETHRVAQAVDGAVGHHNLEVLRPLFSPSKSRPDRTVV